MAIQEIEFYVPIKYNPYVEERYEVSTLGHIRNRKTGHVLINQQRRQNGYASICLQIGNGKQVTFYVHILVADAFYLIRKDFQRLITKIKIRWIRVSQILNGAIGTII